MLTYKVKLKKLDDCLKECEVYKKSKNYWKILRPGSIMAKGLKSDIGFRTYYKGYFGSDKIVNIKKHKKYSNVLQMYSNKGMHMMDIFSDWVDEWVEEEEQVPVILNGLLDKWEELF